MTTESKSADCTFNAAEGIEETGRAMQEREERLVRMKQWLRELDDRVAAVVKQCRERRDERRQQEEAN